jgi:DNA gyrase subunit A
LKPGDELLSMQVAADGAYCVTVTDGGYAKRTPLSDWAPKSRNIQGVRAMRLVPERGGLVGALVCRGADEVMAIADTGSVIRTPVQEVRATGRDTMGVRLMNLREDATVVAIARATDSDVDEQAEDQGSATAQEGDEHPDNGAAIAETTSESVATGSLATATRPRTLDRTTTDSPPQDGDTQEDSR